MSQATDYAKEKAHETKAAVEDAASAVSSTVTGAVHKTMSTVSDGIEAGKHYLAEKDVEKIADDLTRVVKKHPIPALFAGIGLGLLIGNALSRRS